MSSPGWSSPSSLASPHKASVWAPKHLDSLQFIKSYLYWATQLYLAQYSRYGLVSAEQRRTVHPSAYCLWFSWCSPRCFQPSMLPGDTGDSYAAHCPSLQPVWISLDGSHALQHIGWSPQFVIYKLYEEAFPCLLQVIDIKHRSLDRLMRYSACYLPSAKFPPINHHSSSQPTSFSIYKVVR